MHFQLVFADAADDRHKGTMNGIAAVIRRRYDILQRPPHRHTDVLPVFQNAIQIGENSASYGAADMIAGRFQTAVADDNGFLQAECFLQLSLKITVFHSSGVDNFDLDDSPLSAKLQHPRYRRPGDAQ